MNKTVGFIFTAFGILIFATLMLIVIPTAQLAKIPPEPGLKPYSQLELEGRRIYVSQGCVYCHSQQPRDASQAPDTARGWGRPSTPGDYAYDYPHLLGSMRTGPDLFNIGIRQPSGDWHFTHLYQPRALVEWSIMPSFPYFFEIKDKATENDVVVKLPENYQPKNKVVVATHDAIALVAYLKSLKRSYPTSQSIFNGLNHKEEVK